MKRFGVKRREEGKLTKRKGKRAIADCGSQAQSSVLSPQSLKLAIRNPQCHLGFRVFRPPLRARVESVSGRPTRLSARASGRIISGKVVRLAGPWRTSGEWWMEEKWDRAEWDVAVGDSKELYRVYQETHSGVWFVEGVYD